MNTDRGPVHDTSSAGARSSNRPFVLTDMPTWLVLVLVAIGLPRTILADLNVVPPESGLLYYFLALTPFAVWLAVAIVRRTRKPLMDFLVVGALYGISLVIIHQTTWSLTSSVGHPVPAGAVSLAEKFDPAFRELVVRGYTVVVAMIIGIGTGLLVGLVALIAKAVRSKRAKSRSPEHA